MKKRILDTHTHTHTHAYICIRRGLGRNSENMENSYTLLSNQPHKGQLSSCLNKWPLITILKLNVFLVGQLMLASKAFLMLLCSYVRVDHFQHCKWQKEIFRGLHKILTSTILRQACSEVKNKIFEVWPGFEFWF